MDLYKPKQQLDDLDLDDFDTNDQNINSNYDDEQESNDLDNDFREDLDDFGDFAGGGASPLDKHNDLLKDLTNFEPFLKKLTIEWLGLVWDEESSKYVKHPELSPIMNKKGVSWSINYIRTYARDNNILSALREHEYYNIMENIIETIYLNLGTRSKEFGIKTDGDIIKVCNQIHDTAVLILSGAGRSSNYRDFLGTTVSRSESVSLRNDNDQNKPKKNLFNRSFSFLTGK